MNEARDVAWLGDFQRRFSAMLRTPLDRRSGTLRALRERYDRELVAGVTPGPAASPDERLAIYNRQYWFRLFGVLHGAFPLTTRLLGHWTLNDYASRFFLEQPPRHWDIDSAATDFDVFLAEALPSPLAVLGPTGQPTVDSAAVREAVAIDAAYRRLFSAPPGPHFRPAIADPAELMRTRLRPSTTALILEEGWPLVRLRDELSTIAGEAPVPLPPRLPEMQWWALVRQPSATGRFQLAKREAHLFSLLGKHSVGEALAALEADCTSSERAALPINVRRWLARSVDLGFWSGVDQ
jgi:hypothetical protein